MANVEEALESNRKRVESDRKRYLKYYEVDPYDPSHFDIVLDSTGKQPGETLKEALRMIEEFRKHKV